MVWWTQALEIADEFGRPTGRWRMTAKSDEGGGGPFGDTSHDHASAEEAEACDRCDEFIANVSGMPSRKRMAEEDDRRDRAELDRLKAKFGDFDRWHRLTQRALQLKRINVPDGRVRRYEYVYDEEYMCNKVWVDRLTGKEVMRYDAADPANTNSYYGARPDEEFFVRRGLDIYATIDASDAKPLPRFRRWVGYMTTVSKIGS